MYRKFNVTGNFLFCTVHFWRTKQELGQSVGDPTRDEDDIPVVIRAWQAQNFLITALHVKGSAPNVNVIGVTEVQVMTITPSTSINSHAEEITFVS